MKVKNNIISRGERLELTYHDGKRICIVRVFDVLGDRVLIRFKGEKGVHSFRASSLEYLIARE